MLSGARDLGFFDDAQSDHDVFRALAEKASTYDLMRMARLLLLHEKKPDAARTIARLSKGFEYVDPYKSARVRVFKGSFGLPNA